MILLVDKKDPANLLVWQEKNSSISLPAKIDLGASFQRKAFLVSIKLHLKRFFARQPLGFVFFNPPVIGAKD